MNENVQHEVSCFCGAVSITVTGEPEVMGYCHCDSCRNWSAGLTHAFTLYKSTNFNLTKGSDNITGFDKNPVSGDTNVVSNRVWCKTCGGHLYIDHPTMGLIDVPAALIKDLDFKPAFHVHYQETVNKMKDGLPKFKDMPKEVGGSGEEIPE